MNPRHLLPLLAWLCVLPLKAETHLLDDSRSYTEPPAAQMEWLPQSPGDRDGGMETWVRVNIHIDTHDWIGRTGAIFMTLQRDQASTVEAVWTANGPLRSGRLTSGERTLVWAGVIGGDALTDLLQVRLRSGPDWQSASRRLNFQFELDTD
ncbi:hypothetical protein [Hydrogenophaga sp.]|uniref:hypothetical protein n=1 Tax=Hydrogenophaga sp. TaxID=1904254 RepID=UPI0035B0036C